MNRERYVVEEVSHSQLSMVPFSSFRNGREAAKAFKDRQRDEESSSTLCFKRLVVDLPKWGICTYKSNFMDLPPKLADLVKCEKIQSVASLCLNILCCCCRLKTVPV